MRPHPFAGVELASDGEHDDEDDGSGDGGVGL